MKDKTELSTPEGSEQSRPFFARFLEGQETSKNSFQTLKYPSDRDEMDQRFEYTSGNSGPQQ
jgi:Serine endopeptidase inhibitors